MGWIDRLFGRGATPPHSAPNPLAPNPPAPPPPAPTETADQHPQLSTLTAPPANGTAYTLDELLAPHRALLTSLVRPCVDIAMAPVPAADRTPLEPDGMEARASKLGGTPFTPSGKTWPVNRVGARLPLVAQVNFAEAPPLEGLPREGILQVFESEYGVPAEVVDGASDYGFVRYLDPVAARESHVPAGAPPPIDAEEEYASVTTACRMRFTPGTSAGSVNDEAFRGALEAAGLDIDDWWRTERYDAAHEELHERLDASGHRLGGYAAFTQTDPRHGMAAPDDHVHVLQIDSDEHVSFGDVGIAHVFIPRDALAAGDWRRAYYYWDCC